MGLAQHGCIANLLALAEHAGGFGCGGLLRAQLLSSCWASRGGEAANLGGFVFFVAGALVAASTCLVDGPMVRGGRV